MNYAAPATIGCSSFLGNFGILGRHAAWYRTRHNACEQILKRAVRHRRNSLFYKTERGALVGDLFMSLIETCRFCGANPLDYLTALQKHARRVSEHPEQWLPWNYQAALAAANSS